MEQDEGLYAYMNNMYGTNYGQQQQQQPKSTNTSTGLWSGFKELFTPQGQSGVSTGGNMLSGLGSVAGIGTGLAGLYYANKEAKLKEDQAEMQKDAYKRSVAVQKADDARKAQFAKNAGNDAVYTV